MYFNNSSWLALHWMTSDVSSSLSNYLYFHISLFLPITIRIILGLVVFLSPFHHLMKGGISPLSNWGVFAQTRVIRSCCSAFCRICSLSTWNRENIHQSTELASLRWCLFGFIGCGQPCPCGSSVELPQGFAAEQTECDVELLKERQKWDKICNDFLDNLAPSSSPKWKGRRDFQVVPT